MNVSAFLHAGKFTRFYSPQQANAQKSPKNIFSRTWRLFDGPRFSKAAVTHRPAFPYESIELKTKSDLSIGAWYAKADSASKGTIVLFHGLSNSKSSVLQEAGEFRYMGYNVLLIDFRGHGNSDGRITTIGWNETEEIKSAFDWLSAKGEPKIILWGFSMGATAIIKAVRDYDLKVNGMILEMPFASLHKHMRGRAPTLGFPKEPFGSLVTFWTGVRRGFNGFKYNTVRFAEKVNCPVLYQWADRDIYVSKKEAESIFNSFSSKQKKMVVYQNAIHGSLAQQNITRWRVEVEGFLRSLK